MGEGHTHPRLTPKLSEAWSVPLALWWCVSDGTCAILINGSFRMPDPLVADTTDIGLGRLSHRLLNRPAGILALGVTPPAAAGEE